MSLRCVRRFRQCAEAKIRIVFICIYTYIFIIIHFDLIFLHKINLRLSLARGTRENVCNIAPRVKKNRNTLDFDRLLY